MVKVIQLFLLCLFFTRLHAEEATVEANVNQNKAVSHLDIKGTLTITHDPKDAVEIHTVQIDKKKLEVTFVKEVHLSDKTVISIYEFTLPAKEAGDYFLSPISVKVGNKNYTSSPAPYEVKESHRLTVSDSKETPTLKLEAFIQGADELYLGERARLVYRLVYNQSLDITKSDLPLIHSKDFEKVGDAAVDEEQEGDFTVQTISQEIEANKLGTFTLGPSSIEGYAYETNDRGEKEYYSKLLKAEAAPVTVKVERFPKKNQPASFNGSIGKVHVELTSPENRKFEIGDKIFLTATVSGIENLSELKFPKILCQPGFSGLFEFKELVSSIDHTQKVKTFKLELRPLTYLTREIPPIEFSSFDLKERKYQLFKTKPIKFQLANPILKAEVIPEVNQHSFSTDQLAELVNQPLAKQTDESAALIQGAIKQPWTETPWILFALPAGLLLLSAQYIWKQEIANRPKPPVILSRYYFDEAQKKNNSPNLFLKYLELSLQNRLKEGGMNSSREVDLKRILYTVLEFQYGPDKEFSPEDLIKQLKNFLF